MVELVEWLRTQLDEDERIALAAIRAVGDVPSAAQWRFGNAFTDEGGTYWQITTMTPEVGGVGPVELVGSGMSGGGAHEPEFARHAVEHDPARVLREVEAKRQMLVLHHEVKAEDIDYSQCRECGFKTFPCTTLRLLALPYADRPGFKESWRP